MGLEPMLVFQRLILFRAMACAFVALFLSPRQCSIASVVEQNNLFFFFVYKCDYFKLRTIEYSENVLSLFGFNHL